MDRRHFLRTAAVIAAGVVAADQLELLERLAPRRLWTGWTPTLYGDGIHDDTAALQALINGRRVYLNRSRKIYTGWGNIPQGDYRISSTLEVAAGQRIAIQNSSIIGTPRMWDAKPIIRLAPEAGYEIHSNSFLYKG